MAEIEEVDDYSDGYGFDDYDDENRNNALYESLTDFDPYLKTLIMEWLGYYWNDKKQEYVKDEEVTPIMNMHGARWCITFLRTYTRKNNVITRIGEKAFLYMMQDVVKTVWLNIGTRADEFGIEKNGNILSIANQLIHSTELVLCGATGNKAYADDIGQTYKFGETRQGGAMPGGQQQKKGIINGFKRFIGIR